MSKLDAQRAMREARYAATQARAGKTADKASDKPAGKAKRATPTQPRSTPDAADAPGGLCGHRAISGKTCTRERGHTAKSHRYS